MIFTGLELSMNRKHYLVSSLARVYAAALGNHSLASRIKQQTNLIGIGWTKPPLSYLKVSIDGSLERTTERADAGGAIRDDKRKWIFRFIEQLGDCQTNEAEMWGLLHGLNMAWKIGARNFLVETDSLTVYNWVKGVTDLCCTHANVVQECKQRIQRA